MRGPAFALEKQSYKISPESEESSKKCSQVVSSKIPLSIGLYIEMANS